MHMSVNVFMNEQLWIIITVNSSPRRAYVQVYVCIKLCIVFWLKPSWRQELEPIGRIDIVIVYINEGMNT